MSWKGWNSQQKVTKDVQELVRDLVQYHQETYDPQDMRDFMDVYLQEIDNSKSPDFNQEALIATAMDLFSAGSETTATTLSWAVLYLILYPEVQVKVQTEIDAVLNGAEPTLEDRSRYCILVLNGLF